jgi:trehalose 6-phosphate synthase
LNLAFALNVSNTTGDRASNFHFVQDYQLALVPQILAANPQEKPSVFWHIPWPKSVSHDHVQPLVEIATGLLDATQVGFHIAEYAENFMRFVQDYVPGFAVDSMRHTITAIRSGNQKRKQTKIIVQPLGLDLQFWQEHSKNVGSEVLPLQFKLPRYVLSVDRADYTKGVVERLRAINEFFDLYPDWRERVTFVQVCQRTRQGLDAFDRYWEKCLVLVDEVNSRWGTEAWKPLRWVKEPVAPAVLSQLYRGASAMLINPLRDGLNLTAKEFVACAADDASLLLSDGAGVWQEFKDHVTKVQPLDARAMAAAIETGLSMPMRERQQRVVELRKTLQANSLCAWWQRFGGAPAGQVVELSQPLAQVLPVRDLLSARM